MKNRYKAIIVIICVLLVSVTLLAIFGLIESKLNKSDGLNGTGNINQNGEIVYKGEKYVRKNDIQSLLLIGIDSSVNDENTTDNTAADFLLLLVMDRADKTWKLIHINRDTMTEIKQLDKYGNAVKRFDGQITLSHTYGSTPIMRGYNTLYSTEKLLYGVNIEHFMSMTMDAVSIINDGLGGIEVEVLHDFSSVEPELVMGEKILLKGDLALTYVRSRSGMEDSSNVSRMERQKQYLSALVNKMSEVDNDKILSVMNNASQYTESECTVERLSSILSTIHDFEYEGIYSIEGESVKGESYMEFYPDETALQELVIDIFYKKSNK